MSSDSLKRGVAEFVGAFALVFVGAGAIMTSSGDLVTVALAHGFVIAVMASAVGHISGGHFNPAVTFGFFITRRLTGALAILYWVAQLAGAALAALLLWWIYPAQSRDAFDLGAPAVNSAITTGAAVAIEMILTFFLVWVIFASAADPHGTFRSIAGLAIGFTIALGVLMAGPLTGAAMNPARAFGPQLVANFWTDAWIWYLAPLVGGGVAALAYDYLYLRGGEPALVGTRESGVDEPAAGERPY